MHTWQPVGRRSTAYYRKEPFAPVDQMVNRPKFKRENKGSVDRLAGPRPKFKRENKESVDRLVDRPKPRARLSQSVDSRSTAKVSG